MDITGERDGDGVLRDHRIAAELFVEHVDRQIT
jgi:hypothetical protein